MFARLIEGTLAEGEWREVWNHAAECSRCRRLLIYSVRSLGTCALSSSASGRIWALAAAGLVAAALVWLGLFAPAVGRRIPPAGGPSPALADDVPDRDRIHAALRGLLKRGYHPIEVTRLVARAAGAGIRGRDVLELVQAMEKAACDRKDPLRLRDEVLEAASAGSSGQELRRLIRDRLRELPVLPDGGNRTNG